MNKSSVIMGIITIMIRTWFGVADIVRSSVNNTFLMSAVIWMVVAVALILGLTLFEKEKMYQN